MPRTYALSAALALLLLLLAAPLPAADWDTELAIHTAATANKKPDATLLSALREHFSADQLQSGAAISGYMGDFLWAIESDTRPDLYVDDQPVGPMRQLAGSDVWVHTAKVFTGTSHAHYYRIGGEAGRRFDTPAFAKVSYPQPSVPQGTVTEQRIHTSHVYPGWRVSYWVYVSPGYDAAKGAALMVWQDGHRFSVRGDRSRLFTVTENLVQAGKIPPMIHLMVAPTYIGEVRASPYNPGPDRSMRSILYDSMNDDYNTMIVDELLPILAKEWNIREDAYSRGAAGQSSGGICAFTMAWQRPHSFSRVLSRIGSYTSIQWRFGNDNLAENLDGGNVYPFLIRKSPKKNIRVWMEDGGWDLENSHGSWPLQNIQFANSLKYKEYDFRFEFGNAQHNTAHGDARLPQALVWLWRGYDPNKTGQAYEMDPDEKGKEFFRVTKLNRNH